MYLKKEFISIQLQKSLAPISEYVSTNLCKVLNLMRVLCHMSQTVAMQGTPQPNLLKKLPQHID